MTPTNFQVLTYNFETAEWTNETQIERNEIGYRIDDKTTIMHLSITVNVVTSKLIKIIEDIGATYADDLEGLTHPLKDVISLIWSDPMDELLQENLYVLFDKLLDIVYCIYELLDEVWHGVSYVIESKLSQISMRILEIVDQMKTLSETGSNDFDAIVTKIKETIVELTMSLVGLTSITTSIAQLITTRDRSVAVIVGTIASLIIIHQYVVAAVACLLSRAVKIVDSFDALHAVGIPSLEATIVNFISNLELILNNNLKEATMTELFHGNLHTKFSIHLLIAVKELIGDKMISTIYTSTTSLLNIIQEHAPRAFHVLPDLLGQLTVILLRCGQTEFCKLEQYITYAFDGLYDVLHHISYNLDRHIQSSASTGSFPEPSEPIDIGVGHVRAAVKRFIYDSQHSSETNTIDLIASTIDLLKAILDPMNIVINKSDGDYSVTLIASLQFFALYVIGLVTTPFISAINRIGDVGRNSELYSIFDATLSLALIKIQMVFDYTNTENTMEVLERLYDSFDDLLQELTRLNGGDAEATTTKANGMFNWSHISSIQFKKTSSL